MPLTHRCIDIFGYCLSPETPERQNVNYPDGTLYANSIVTCKFNPNTCQHYQTHTQTVQEQQARSQTQTLQTPST